MIVKVNLEYTPPPPPPPPPTPPVPTVEKYNFCQLCFILT